MAVRRKTTEPIASRLYTRKQAAEYLGVSSGTLSRWAAERSDGPPFVKLGDSDKAGVRYPLDGLDEFIDSRMKRPK